MKSNFGLHLSSTQQLSGSISIFKISASVKKHAFLPFFAKIGILFLSLLFGLSGMQAQTRYHVDLSATGANNGSSWANAFTDLQAALGLAQSGDSVWIAQGTYYTTSSTDRMISFKPRSGVRIFGGFSGTENDLAQRDWDAHPTLLSGDIGVMGDSTDNTNNIMLFGEVEEGTVLDGLSFRGGYSEGTFVYDIFQREGCGGAVYVNAEDGVAYLVIRNCRFERNYAQLKGGAVFVRASQDGSIAPQFLNCVFEYNSGNDGVAVYCNGYADIERVPDFGDCTFTANRILSNAPLSIVRYINPATDDTLHFWGCKFEKQAGYFASWRNISTKSDNHIRLDRCLFKDNKNTAIRSDVFAPTIGRVKSLYVANSKFLNNLGLGLSFATDEKVLSCVFKKNIGGISTNAPKTEISYCIIDSCKSGPGLISLSEECEDCKVSNTTISNNTPYTPGYGITLFWVIKNDEFVTYQNISIFNNDSMGLFHANIYGDSATFTNFNVIGNRLFLNTNSSSILTVPARFQNSIFYGNEFINPDYYALYPSLTFENCSIDYPDCSYFPPTVTCINNLFNQDPLFRDTANHDYTLLPCSPLLNAGSNAATSGILTDIAGNPRIQDGTVDIGAYESPAFALAAEPQVQPACVGATNGSITVIPVFGCEPYTYTWLPAAGSGPELNGLPPGFYQLTITDGSGRQILDTLEVVEAPSPHLNPLTTDVQCSNGLGGSISAGLSSGTAPYHYQWQPLAADTAMLDHLSPGSYALTVVDAQGCQDSAKASIALLGMLTPSIDGQSISCPGAADGWLSLTPSTGAAPFSWLWTGWPGTDAKAQPLGPGQYSVTVTDAYGCTASNTFPPMNDPASISASLLVSDQSNLNMPNGSAIVTSTSGGTPFPGMPPYYQYDWSTGEMGTSIAGLSAGSYTLLVTDSHGCTSIQAFEVQLMVGTAELEGAAFLLYPNPAADWLRVVLPAHTGKYQVELSDASGRVVRSQELPGGATDCQLDLRGLPGGTYQVSVLEEVKSGVWVGKLIKR